MRSAAETTCTRAPADEAELVVLALGLLSDVNIADVCDGEDMRILCKDEVPKLFGIWTEDTTGFKAVARLDMCALRAPEGDLERLDEGHKSLEASGLGELPLAERFLVIGLVCNLRGGAEIVVGGRKTGCLTREYRENLYCGCKYRVVEPI